MYKVVVVEDESMVRKGIILTIDWSALDCVVVGDAANGEEGVELVDRLKPDIVVSDVKMPRMDGVEMIEQLRKQGCKAKFIILTAYSDFKYAQSALRLGVSDYLLKPLKDGELEGAVRKILSVVEVGTIQAEEEASMVIHLRSAKNAKNKYVEQAIRFIEAHYREDITLYRMKVATKLLSDCRVKVYEVADQVGYSDTAYFSAQFKKFLGVSPSEYQDRN